MGRSPLEDSIFYMHISLGIVLAVAGISLVVSCFVLDQCLYWSIAGEILIAMTLKGVIGARSWHSALLLATMGLLLLAYSCPVRVEGLTLGYFRHCRPLSYADKAELPL